MFFLQEIFKLISFFPDTSRSSVTRCKPGANCPSSHSSISRQLSPLSVTEDSSAPILELQSRGSSGVCGHRAERQNKSQLTLKHPCSLKKETGQPDGTPAPCLLPTQNPEQQQGGRGWASATHSDDPAARGPRRLDAAVAASAPWEALEERC